MGEISDDLLFDLMQEGFERDRLRVSTPSKARDLQEHWAERESRCPVQWQSPWTLPQKYTSKEPVQQHLEETS